jgi:YbbR domain-containing protein
MKLAARMTKVVLLAVSFILSMVLYLYVQQINPNAKEQVSLIARSQNLAPGLVFDQEGTPVAYDVTGPKDVIGLLQNRLKDNPAYLVAVTDLRQIEPSRVHGKLPILPVRLTISSIPSDFDSLTFTEEGHLDGAVEREKTSDVRIRVKFANSTQANGDNPPDPNDFEVTPPKLTLTGSATDVDNADPFVVIDPQEIERDGIKSLPLDISAKLASSPNVERVEVKAARRQRAVYVNVLFMGRPAEGYRVSNYYVVAGPGSKNTSSTTMIEGPAGLVERTSAIDASIDISGIKKSYTFKPEPKMAERLSLLESPLQIHVDIEKIPR